MKQITIDDLIPFLKKGWVACDKDGDWKWFYFKPRIWTGREKWFDKALTLKKGSKIYVPNGSGVYNVVTTTADYSFSYDFYQFNIAPYQGDWKDSLRRIK